MALSATSVFPNLVVINLDPVHICMKYDGTFGRKRSTAGGVVFRLIMSKFNVITEDIEEGY